MRAVSPLFNNTSTHPFVTHWL